MTIQQFIDQYQFHYFGTEEAKSREISGLYATDLLSWVMGHSKANQGWITVQTHANVVAVAMLQELSCIIVAESAPIPEETLAKAREEGIPILQSSLPVYEICALYSKDFG